MRPLRSFRHTRVSNALIVALALTGVAGTRAQDPFAAPAAPATPTPPAAPTPPTAPAPAADAQAGASAAAKPKELSVLEAVKKVPFSRSPQLILDESAAAARPAVTEPALPPKEGEKKEGAQPTQPVNPHEADVKALQRAVALARWPEVAKFFAEKFKDKPDDAKQAYLYLLDSLSVDPRNQNRGGSPGGSMPQPQPMMMNGGGGGGNAQQIFRETQLVTPDDILALADLTPGDFEQPIFDKLGNLLRIAADRGSRLESMMDALEKGTARLGGNDTAKRVLAARLLFPAGREVEAGKFLPPPEKAVEAKNWEQLTLIARHFIAKFAEEGKADWLEKAWAVVQGTLALDNLKPEQRADALRRAMELAPRVKAELGEKWLVESFTTDPARGIEILAAIGSAIARDRMNFSADVRKSNLDLQSRVVSTLLKAAPQKANDWREPLTVLALNWLQEARWSVMRDSSTQRGPRMQYDPFGNVYFVSDDGMMMQNMDGGGRREPAAIPSGSLLDLKPDGPWLERVEPSLRSALTAQVAELFLKVNEPEAAFPLIEQAAATLKDEGKRLAERFLQVWTEKHDPNADERRTNRYMYVYGYNPQADGIPLTRSKQVRNLQELSGWIKKLRALPIEPIDENLISAAFTKTHSQAEVYRIEDMEAVFGDLDKMKPETLSALVQSMRQNLASVWRAPKVQQDNKTKRSDKQIQAQVMQGYQDAQEALEPAMKAHPENWGLRLAKAAVVFDSLVYQGTLAPNAEFSKKRDAAFADFAAAAELYTKALPTLRTTEQTAQPFLMWFYASLGSSDLEAIKVEYPETPKQIPLIREALGRLTGEAGKKHLAEFANAVSTRMSAVQPELKHRYLGAGLQIVGDHERAREAKQLWDYYQDLVTEIKLVARLDGSDKVGSTEPFGLFVEIRHTQAIERESGGFQKYLQNQKNSGYYYNFGRPPENYREKFEEAARKALQESFDVQSVTFHADKIESRGTDDGDWRVTPYAYFLLKPKGPQVDAVPSLKLSLDFLDTSGFVVLPVESGRLPIDCSSAAEARPLAGLEVKQILDERKAAEGVLALEVRATGHGLIPALGSLVDVKPKEFDLESTEDQGVHVVQLDGEAEENSVITERLWNLTFRAKKDLVGRPAAFQFGAVKPAEVKASYFRYADADLADVGSPEASLTESYQSKQTMWKRITQVAPWLAGFAAFGAGVWLLLRGRRKSADVSADPFPLPDEINPLTVLGLLRRIQDRGRIKPAQTEELNATISQLEAHFYGTNGVEPLDLATTARTWASRAR